MPSACLGNNCCDRDHIPKDEKQRECAPHARVVAKAPVKAWERRFYGAAADKELVKEPVYDVKVLDKLVTRVAREVRLLEQALKATNAKTIIDGYNQDDAVLGELT